MPAARRNAAMLPPILAAAALSFCARGSPPPPPDSITISVPYEIDTLDPHASGSAGSLAIASHFYEPLVTTDPSMRLIPCLAERWDNPDPTTWVFHLRQTARFHSGKPLTAADVVFSIDRVRTDPALELST